MFAGSMTRVFVVLSSFVAAVFVLSCTNVLAEDDVKIKELKEKLVIANKILDLKDLAKPLGHISVRIPGTDTFLITRSVAPGMATLEDILVCDLNGKVLEGKYQRSYGEIAAHTGVYKKRKDINSVAHTHSIHVIALSMTETPIVPASITSFTAGYEPIAILKKVAFIDNPVIAAEVADLLGPNNAVMLKGHGAVVVGKSLEECVDNAVALENAAQLQVLASSVARVVPMTQDQKQPLVDYLKKAGGSGAARAWAYYVSLLKK